jgi:dTDP-glucose 4,6-dehydratase
MKLLITGGAGFIGSAFIRWALAEHPEAEIINLDKLTYAGNLENLTSVEADPRYRFVRADICDADAVTAVFTEAKPDVVVHFAAESHVDRSILSPTAAIDTNVRGTFVLLEAARGHGVRRFVHVSTDEVYGSLDEPIHADESFPLLPSSPYSASKAGSDLLALSYVKTYGLDVVITRAANNYGPYQFPEKLIPLMISNALDGETLPVYGDGQQVRDWLHVEDHCRAIWAVLTAGTRGSIYNISADQPMANLDLVRRILQVVGAGESLIRYVTDRPGHDRRYAITSDKLRRETDWTPQHTIADGLAETVEWYRRNQEWVRRVKSKSYMEYYENNYAGRASHRSADAGRTHGASHAS